MSVPCISDAPELPHAHPRAWCDIVPAKSKILNYQLTTPSLTPPTLSSHADLRSSFSFFCRCTFQGGDNSNVWMQDADLEGVTHVFVDEVPLHTSSREKKCYG